MDEGQKQYRLFLDGDNRGLEAIIRLYKDGLIFYLNTILHDLSAAESVAEDTFATVDALTGELLTSQKAALAKDSAQ